MRGATRENHHIVRIVEISIHAPHARSDRIYTAHSTAHSDISIHAPHARSDGVTYHLTEMRHNFNPRSSCEERRDRITWTLQFDAFQSTLLMRGATISGTCALRSRNSFQSTLLMRGATRDNALDALHVDISIHAPHARSDFFEQIALANIKISIHAPHARSDSSAST